MCVMLERFVGASEWRPDHPSTVTPQMARSVPGTRSNGKAGSESTGRPPVCQRLNRSPRFVHLARYAVSDRAAAALEGVISITMLVILFAMVIEIASALQLQIRVERAAWAIGRANALEAAPAASLEELEARIRAVLEAEVGVDLDPGDFEIELTAYDTAASMEQGTPAENPSTYLGGDANDLVVVRVWYTPPGNQVFQSLLDTPAISAVAVVRNEAELGSEPELADL